MLERLLAIDHRPSPLPILLVAVAAPASAQLGDVYCAPPSSATGPPARLGAVGSLDVVDDDFELRGNGLPVGAIGYTLVSRQRAAPAAVIGTGLCLGGAVGRDTAHPFVADGAGAATRRLSLASLPLPGGPIAAEPGDSLNFQLWYRDAASSAFSEALAVTFRPPPWFAAELLSLGRNASFPRFVDLDLDGELDALGADWQVGTLAVARGRGDGTFGRAVVSRSHPRHFPVHVVDLDADGVLDVVLLDKDSPTWPPVSYPLLAQGGLGALRFGAPRSLGIDLDVYVSVFGDLDGDGRDDLVTLASPTSSILSLYRSNGAGGFDLAAALALAQHPTWVELVDIDSDGDLDVVSGATPSSAFEVRRRVGPFDFGPPIPGPTNLLFGRPKFQDLNGDGLVDLMAELGPSVSVRPGLGDGTFGSEARYAVVGSIVAFEDHDRDGDVDALLQDSQTLRLLVNRGDLFYVAEAPTLSLAPFGVTRLFRDVDQDGLADVVHGEGPALRIALGRGSLEFSPTTPPLEPLGLPPCIALASRTADYDADGRPEVVFAYAYDNLVDVGIALYERDPLGGAGELRLHPIGLLPLSLALADLDNDGLDDLVVRTSGGVTSLLYRGAAGFAQQGSASTPNLEFVAEPADFDGDGDVDAISMEFSGTFHFHRNDGAGRLDLAPFLGPPHAPQLEQLHAADLDGDGDTELFGTRHSPGGLNVYDNLGGGNGFATLAHYPLLWYGTKVLHGDFDGDGRRDVISAGVELAVLRGAPGGGFEPAVYLPWWLGGYARDAVAADLEPDGDLDLLIVDEHALLSFLNSGSGAFTLGPALPIQFTPSLRVFDDDGDGDAEVYLHLGLWNWLTRAENLCR